MRKHPENRLHIVRAERRMTQTALAFKIKMGRYRYWQIENRYIEGTPVERARIAAALKVSIDEIFPGSAPVQQESVAS